MTTEPSRVIPLRAEIDNHQSQLRTHGKVLSTNCWYKQKCEHGRSSSDAMQKAQPEEVKSLREASLLEA